MKTGGYGTVYKAVLQERRISAAAKAVYAYLCSFAGSGNTCFPSKEKICYDLAISKNTLGKYLRELSSAGVIEISQARDRGHFSRNVYTISHTPLPCTEDNVNQNMVHREVTAKKNSIKNNSEKINNSSSGRGGAENNDRGLYGKKAYGSFKNVFLTEDERKELERRFGGCAGLIERFSAYIASSGRQYANHYAALVKWALDDKKAAENRYRQRSTFTDYDGTVEGMDPFEIAQFKRLHNVE